MTSSVENQQIPEKLLGRDVLLFDGNCVLCHGLVKKLFEVDEDKHFLIGSQQSELAKLVLERHGVNVADLSTVYLVKNCATDKEELLTRSSATLYTLSKTKKYAWLAKLLSMIPRPILDIGYKIVAANRYRMFGTTTESCAIPSPEDRARFID